MRLASTHVSILQWTFITTTITKFGYSDCVKWIHWIEETTRDTRETIASVFPKRLSIVSMLGVSGFETSNFCNVSDVNVTDASPQLALTVVLRSVLMLLPPRKEHLQ